MRRCELNDYERRAIRPLLPKKPRAVPRVDDRRMLNVILYRFRTGSPLREIPERYGPLASYRPSSPQLIHAPLLWLRRTV
jgi:transposase